MNELSLFDGMSCGQIALNRIGVKPSTYYASELDKYAIKVTQANYPDTVQLGDVTQWREWDIDWASIDLLIGGSPCQGFSFAGKQLAFDDPRSKLFFVYVDILNHIKSVNPNIKFMLENVKMKKEYLAVISERLGVEPVFINSALVSAQNRRRYYWCNWDVAQPEDKGIVLADVLEKEVDEKYFLSEKLLNGFIAKQKRRKEKKSGFDNLAVVDLNGKSPTITGRYHKTAMSDPVIMLRPRGNNKGGGRALNGKTPSLTSNSFEHNAILAVAGTYRRFTPIECERLQGVEDNYTNHVSNTQRYKMLGNGWTVDVIAHIFSQMQVPISLLSRQLDLFGEAA